MTQNFHKAFGLGDNEKTIATVDADGVAFAAIQAQQILIEEQTQQMSVIKEQLNDI